jgi:energy-coupling factor transporter ATP-binding protein EcfA2
MSEEKMFSITLPKNKDDIEVIKTSKSLLFLGANGSGKTRLGTWIEFKSPQKDKVHRISAQKSLSMPDSTTPKSIDLAESALLFGSEEAVKKNNGFAYKEGHRWQQKPAVSLLNDYGALMIYLFSDHIEESAKYLAASKNSIERVTPPTTKLDKVKAIWEKILPHRELILGGLRIQTRIKENQEKIYNSSEMSDGERVIFYLIGQCLAAREDAIIVIDEPEIHLHKSVQAPLWAEIEKARPDCLFVYLTHDVDFAAAQEGTQRIWLKSFDGEEWDWERIEPDQNLPDELLLEVIGSRKPVVFVEGENGSFDVSLYREILPDFLVVPRGSCTQVIQSVKALKNNRQLHHLDVYGIIDRDRRVDAEITGLERDSIFVLKVAEVENLFCTREILAIVSRRLARDPDGDFTEVSDKLFNRLESELEKQVSLHVASEIKFRFNNFNDNATGTAALCSALQSLVTEIDVNAIYAEIENKFNTVITSKDYDALLKLFNRKTLPKQISGDLGIANGDLQETVLRLARGECRSEIANALKPYFGNFSQHIKSS